MTDKKFFDFNDGGNLQSGDKLVGIRASDPNNYYKFNPVIISASSIYYIDMLGNDTTGTGSQLQPWATLSHALATVSAGSSSSPNLFKISGAITDGGTVNLRPYDHLCFEANANFTASGGIGLASSWTAGGSLILSGPGIINSAINFDHMSVGGTVAATISLLNCSIPQNITLTSTWQFPGSHNPIDTFYIKGGILTGTNITVSGGTLYTQDNLSASNFILNNGSNTLNVGWVADNERFAYTGGAQNIQVTTANPATVSITMHNCVQPNAGTVTGSGSTFWNMDTNSYKAPSGGVITISNSTLPSAVQGNITQLGSQAQALNMNSHLINNVTDPSGSQDAATKNYVDVLSTAARENIVIGGNADTAAWQEGVTFSSIANNTYVVSMFKYETVGSGACTFAKVADNLAFTGFNVTNCYGLTVTTADSSIASTDIYNLVIPIEGINFNRIAQTAFTVKIRLKSNVTGVQCIAFGNTGNDRAYVAECNIAVAGTAQDFVINVPASPSGGTWAYTDGTLGLRISLPMAAGSNFQTTANAWNTVGSKAVATSNQVNRMATNANYLYFNLLNVQPGTFSDLIYTFEDRSRIIARSQRYFYSTYDFTGGVYPGTATQNGMYGSNVPVGGNASFGINNLFKQTMALDPTIQTYDLNGTSGKIFVGANGITPTVDSIGINGCRVTGSNTGVSGMALQLTARAAII